MEWIAFAAAFVLFFLSHSLPIRPPLRPWLQARLGRRGFVAAYSLLSLAVVGWLVAAAGRAPHVPIWSWAPWQNTLVIAAMLPVCLILAMSVGRPNPLSFGGARNERFDPARPGLVRWTRHPILLALAIWSLAHLLANGDLAHVLLFGTFSIFALAGGRLVDRRKRAELGADWDRLTQAMRTAPSPALRFPGAGGALRVLAALGLYALLLWGHPLLFGVSPIP